MLKSGLVIALTFDTDSEKALRVIFVIFIECGISSRCTFCKTPVSSFAHIEKFSYSY